MCVCVCVCVCVCLIKCSLAQVFVSLYQCWVVCEVVHAQSYMCTYMYPNVLCILFVLMLEEFICINYSHTGILRVHGACIFIQSHR